MHSQDSSRRSRFVLRGVVLDLLVLFAFAFGLRAAEPISAPDSSTLGGLYGKAACNVNPFDFSFTASAGIALPEEFGAALEDSDEMLRADIQQRTGGPDQAMIEPKVLAKAVPARHPSISPPLLV